MPENLQPPARVAITGANGQLGTQLSALLGQRARGFDIQQMDITSESDVRRMLSEYRPEVLINAAAYTAVDAAENAPERCFSVNRDAVALLSRLTADADCRLVQISTDYVFTASRQRTPFDEEAAIAPAGVYAQSKAMAEAEARRHPNHLIARTCGLYGPVIAKASGNFVNTMIKLGREQDTLQVVNDQVCCPTYVYELARALVYLIDHRYTGTFHLTNTGPMTWFEMAQQIFEIADITCEVSSISTAQYNALAPRPAYSVLDTSKYHATGGPRFSTCSDALRSFLCPSNAALPEESAAPISEANTTTSPEVR